MFTISAAARQTGITAATLRKWESRYGFPVPVRTVGDQRAFCASDLAALIEISRRMANGQRAGAAIQAVKRGQRQAEPDAIQATSPNEAVVADAMARLRHNDLKSLEDCLANHFTRYGAAVFTSALAIPMIQAVGTAWQQGRLPIYVEHLFTASLHKVVLQNMARLPQQPTSVAQVLLASPAAETHTLALVLLNAVLLEAGIPTVYLQGGMPAAEIAAAAAAFKVQVVALSASAACPPRLLSMELRSLRALLDAQVELWVGGAGTRRISARMDGVTVMASMDAAVQTLKDKFGRSPNRVGSEQDTNHG